MQWLIFAPIAVGSVCVLLLIHHGDWLTTRLANKHGIHFQRNIRLPSDKLHAFVMKRREFALNDELLTKRARLYRRIWLVTFAAWIAQGYVVLSNLGK